MPVTGRQNFPIRREISAFHPQTPFLESAPLCPARDNEVCREVDLTT